jgi:MSHA type pilus biogenesis protein MshL
LGNPTTIDLAPEKIIADNSKEFSERMKTLRASLERVKKVEAPVEAVKPVYDPLADIKLSLVVEEQSVHKVLRAVASQSKMNLLIDPQIIPEDHLITVDFHDTSASVVIRQLLDLTDLHGTIKDNMIVVKAMESDIFHLSFMESDLESSFSAGGDVLGGAGVQGSSAGQVKGEFTVSGTEMPSSNPYEALETMLGELVGESGGTYSMNRLNGSLYVSAKPSAMKTIRSMVQDYEDSMSRQVLIEAQFVEVDLNDSFKWGIDWTSLRDDVAFAFSPTGETLNGIAETTFGNLNQGARTITIPSSTAAPEGTTFRGYGMTQDVAVAIEMIQKYGDVSVISHPSIRVKHGLPAMISIGTSATYISDTKVTNNNSGGGVVTTQEVKTKNVFDGLMLGVVSFIAKNEDITLGVHPVQSKVNPQSLVLQDVGGDTRVSLPVVELKSIVTQLKLRDGDMVILGGLIDQDDSKLSNEVPGLGAIPFLGNLFKNKENAKSIKELVIILKVNMV